MRIAVTYNNGLVYPHYSRTPQFKIYDVIGGRIADTQVVFAHGSIRHSSVNDLLRDYRVDALLCGRIGIATRLIVAAMGIKIVDRISGNADHAVAAYLGIPMAPPPPKPAPKPEVPRRNTAPRPAAAPQPPRSKPSHSVGGGAPSRHNPPHNHGGIGRPSRNGRFK